MLHYIVMIMEAYASVAHVVLNWAEAAGVALLNHAINDVNHTIVRHDIRLDDLRATDVERTVDEARIDWTIKRLQRNRTVGDGLQRQLSGEFTGDDMLAKNIPQTR